ncbi:hypothetical protein ACHAXN_004329 [Cyclotella atomus]
MAADRQWLFDNQSRCLLGAYHPCVFQHDPAEEFYKAVEFVGVHEVRQCCVILPICKYAYESIRIYWPAARVSFSHLLLCFSLKRCKQEQSNGLVPSSLCAQ